ncbi:hypothetical protein BGW39_008538 [Mortierella sp. 14UC]|nr:hypothetical protein BGW39_008538 [Mortierella sp. 14UC]
MSKRDRDDEGGSRKNVSGSNSKGSDKSTVTGTSTNTSTNTNIIASSSTKISPSSTTTTTSVDKKPIPSTTPSSGIIRKVAGDLERSETSVFDSSNSRKDRIDPQQLLLQQQQLHSSSSSNLALATASLQERQQQQQHQNTSDKDQYNNINASRHTDLPQLQIRQGSVATTTSTIDNQNSWARSPSILSSTSSPFQSPASSTTTADSHMGPSLDSASHSQQPFKLADARGQQTGLDPSRPGTTMEHPSSTPSEQPCQHHQQQSDSAPLQSQLGNITTMVPFLALEAVDEKINHLDNLWRSGSDKLAQTVKVTEQGVLTCVLQQVLEETRVYANLREALQNQDPNGDIRTIGILNETMRQLEARRKYDIRCLQPGVPIPEMPLDQSIPISLDNIDVNGYHVAVNSSNDNGPESTTIKPATEAAAATSSATDMQQLSTSSDIPTTTPDNFRKRPLSSEGTESGHSQLTKTTKKRHQISLPPKPASSSKQQSSLATIAGSGGGGGLVKSAGQRSTLGTATTAAPTPVTTVSAPVQESGSVASKNKPSTTPTPTPGSITPATATVSSSTSARVKNTIIADPSTFSSLTSSPPVVVVANSTSSSSTTTTAATPLNAKSGPSPAPGDIAATTAAVAATAWTASTGGRAILDIEQELRLIRQEGQEQRLRTDQLLAQLESEARLRRESDARVAQLTRDLQNERYLTLEKDLESKRSEALLMMARAREELQHGRVLIAQAKEELAVERAAKAEAMMETARVQIERDRLLAYVQSLDVSGFGSGYGSGPGSVAETLSGGAGAKSAVFSPVALPSGPAGSASDNTATDVTPLKVKMSS